MGRCETIEIGRRMQNPSRIVVGDVLSLLPRFLPAGRRAILITDRNVFELYRGTIERYEHLVIPPGEQSKTLSTVESLHSRLIETGADRSTFIVGFGGGVVTDVAGFVASTYMRGVDFGFVATTLLAQADASVGGKNGVNVAGYKNMAGTFNQPDFVLCDTGALATLPPREFRTGLAEVIKAAVIADPALFEILETHSPEQLSADKEMLAGAVSAAIRVKARIVEADETEKGERRLLNLGHTVAHALEKISCEYTHGEAVAIGIAAAAGISVKLGMLSALERGRIVGALQNAGLPVESALQKEKIIEAVSRDKKIEGPLLRLVVVRGIGDVLIRPTALDELAALMQE